MWLFCMFLLYFLLETPVGFLPAHLHYKERGSSLEEGLIVVSNIKTEIELWKDFLIRMETRYNQYFQFKVLGL